MSDHPILLLIMIVLGQVIEDHGIPWVKSTNSSPEGSCFKYERQPRMCNEVAGELPDSFSYPAKMRHVAAKGIISLGNHRRI